MKSSHFQLKRVGVEDYPAVVKIWEDCFTEELDYIERFIRELLPYSESWGVIPTDHSQVVAIATLLPSYSLLGARKEKIVGGYLYGVGTLTPYRGRGYSKRLSHKIIESSREQGLSYLLVKPAESSLYSLYSSLTFDTLLENWQIRMALPTTPCAIEELGWTFRERAEEEIFNHFLLREEQFEKQFLWPKEVLNYSKLELISRGGKVVELSPTREKLKKRLYWWGYLHEEEPQLLLIKEHNIKSGEELTLLLKSASSLFPQARELLIEFSKNEELNSIKELLRTKELPSLQKSGLIKFFTQREIIKEELILKQLSLSME